MTTIRTTYFLITALTFLFLSCKDNIKKPDTSLTTTRQLTEAEKRKFFQDSIGMWMYNNKDHEPTDRKNFKCFIDKYYPDIKAKNKYDAFIYAFEEQYVDPNKFDSTKNWIRITVEPCFSKPYCLVLEKKNGKAYLTTKITNGDGGYASGLLIFSFTKMFDDTLYNSISNQLKQIDFWKLPQDRDTTCKKGFDGEQCFFEAIENGKYNFVGRWMPSSCGNKSTLQLGRIRTELRDKSKLVEILKVVADEKHNKLDNY